MATRDTMYSTHVFIRAVLPLFRVIAEQTPLGRKFAGRDGRIQFRINVDGTVLGMHFELEQGQLAPCLELCDKPDVELYFPTAEHFVAFFKGTSKKLPKIHGFGKLPLLIPTFRILLKMAKLLQSNTCPVKEDDRLLLIRLMFYLLPAGISTLNKLGHPDVVSWSAISPDRVYAWTLDGHPDIASHIRVKAGKTRSSRGSYTRSQPFYTMRFADPVSAIGVLQQTADMLKLTAEEKLIMEGAPEFGSKIGDLMMLVGSYTQP